MEDGPAWLKKLISETQAAHSALPDDIPSTLSDLLIGEFGTAQLTPKRLTEVADLILSTLTDDEEAADENPDN